MTTRSQVIAERGLDLSNSKIDLEVLALEFKDRILPAFPFVDKAIAMAKGLMTAYQGISSLKGPITPLAIYGLAISALQTAAGLLEGRLDDDIAENFTRLERARNETIQRHVGLGDWSVVVKAGG